MFGSFLHSPVTDFIYALFKPLIYLCKYTQNIPRYACQQLALLQIPVPTLWPFDKVRHTHSVPHVTAHRTLVHFYCTELLSSHMNTVLRYGFISKLSRPNVCSQNACAAPYTYNHPMLIFTCTHHVFQIIQTPFPELSYFCHQKKKKKVAVTCGVTCIFFTNDLYKWSSILDITCLS